MAYIKNETTGVCISHFVSLEVKQEVIRTTQQLLDGSVYIQRIGEPTVSYTVSAYVDRAGKALFQNAEDTAALLEVSVKHGLYYGRISELSFSERLAGDWFKATAILAKEAAI